MSEVITLQTVKAEHARLAALIAQLEQQPASYTIEEAEIVLAAGEHYAGLVLDEQGRVSHHLVLLPGQADSVTWDKARDWAASGCRVHARQRIGLGPAAQYAGRNKASHLRRGARVRVVASALEIVRDSVRVFGVDRIEALDAPVQERVAA